MEHYILYYAIEVVVGVLALERSPQFIVWAVVEQIVLEVLRVRHFICITTQIYHIDTTCVTRMRTL